MTPKQTGGLIAAAAIVLLAGLLATTLEAPIKADAGLDPLRETLVDLAAGIRSETIDTCDEAQTDCHDQEVQQ